MPGSSEVAFANATVLCNIEDKVEFFAYASHYELTRPVTLHTTLKVHGLVKGPLEGKLQLQFGLTDTTMRMFKDLTLIANEAGAKATRITWTQSDGTAIGELTFQGYIAGLRLTTGLDQPDQVTIEMVILSDAVTGNLQQQIEA